MGIEPEWRYSHQVLENAGHFIQEDRGEDLARMIVEWLG